jgi:hypothetical protein
MKAPFWEVIAVQFTYHSEHTNALYVQEVELVNVDADGSYSYLNY